MELPAFDTHTFVKRLTKAGMPVEQAEILSEEQASLVTGRLATKEDLALLGKDLRREIGDLRKDMDAKFAGVDTKFAGIDAKFAGLEERFNAKLLNMEERFNAKLDKISLQIVNKLGGLIVAGIVVIAAIPVLFKYLHVG